eukprot:961211-Amorphochlora_amoeboformis.AAC.1
MREDIPLERGRTEKERTEIGRTEKERTEIGRTERGKENDVSLLDVFKESEMKLETTQNSSTRSGDGGRNRRVRRACETYFRFRTLDIYIVYISISLYT